jgi:hypothetical protein
LALGPAAASAITVADWLKRHPESGTALHLDPHKSDEAAATFLAALGPNIVRNDVAKLVALYELARLQDPERTEPHALAANPAELLNDALNALEGHQEGLLMTNGPDSHLVKDVERQRLFLRDGRGELEKLTRSSPNEPG